MSLYRSWRPKSFADLVGQDAVVRTLRAALTSGKLAHAYLFSGPRGSGKTSAAKILARCIECRLGPTADPDNSCDFCLAILAGTALDVMEIDAASNRGIDEIRALRESAKFAPSVMRAKVFIVDEAHMLTREGANAFLKTLEEPPEHTIFILATTAPEALPPTILSRCQRYAFRRIGVATMIARMREIATAEGIVIDDAALGAIAYRADGGLRDALTMLEQVAAYAGGPIEVATVDAAFGTTGRQAAQALVRAVLSGDAAGALRAVDEANDAGADMVALLRSAIGEYRDLLVARLEPGLLERDLSAEDAQAVRELAQRSAAPSVVRGLRVLSDALAAARSSGNPRLEVETAILRLIVQGEDTSLEALAARVSLLEGSDGAAPVTDRPRAGAGPNVRIEARERDAPAKDLPRPHRAPREVASPAGLPEKPEPTLVRVRSLWQNIRTRAENEKMPLRAPLSRATVDAVTGDAVVLRVNEESLGSLLRDNSAIVERAIADVLGRPLRVQVRIDAGARPSAHRAAPQDAAGDGSSGENSDDAENDLLAYAAQKQLGRAE